LCGFTAPDGCRRDHTKNFRERGMDRMPDGTKEVGLWPTPQKRTRKKTASDEVKTSLMNKYRETFIDKLTPQDLEELQCYLRQQYDIEHGWNNEYRLKFEFKLRQYFHEEILKREIASIETLLGLLQPQDLKM